MHPILARSQPQSARESADAEFGLGVRLRELLAAAACSHEEASDQLEAITSMEGAKFSIARHLYR